MKDPAQEALIREVTEEVVALTRKYGGLLWGEHGKGVRSEFSPAFFGPLYPMLCRRSRRPSTRATSSIPARSPRPATGRAADDRRRADPRASPTAPSRRTSGPASTRRCTATATAPASTGTRTTPCARPGRDARAAALAQGPGPADARMAAPAGGAGRRSGRGKPPPAPAPGAGAPCRPACATPWPGAAARRTSRTRSRRRWTAASPASPASASARSRSTCPSFRAKFLELYTAATCARCGTTSVGSLEHLVPLMARMPRLYNALRRAAVRGGRRCGRSASWTRPRCPASSLRPSSSERGVAIATPAALRALTWRRAAPQRRPRAGRLHQLLRDAARPRPARPAPGARLPALAGAVPAQRQAAARARLPRRLRAGGRARTPRCCGIWPRTGSTDRPRSLDDADLPRRICRARSRRSHVPRVRLRAGMAGGASRPDHRCRARRRLPAAAPLHRADHGAAACPRLADGLRPASA